MCAAARQVLAAAHVKVEDVALVVPHQANLRILNAVRKTLDLDPEQLFINVENYGNTGSASVPLALCQARAAGRMKPGDLVLLVSFGAGFHWAAMHHSRWDKYTDPRLHHMLYLRRTDHRTRRELCFR